MQYAIVRDGSDLMAYDFNTAKKIDNWSLSAIDLSPAALVIDKVVVAQGGRIGVGSIADPDQSNMIWRSFWPMYSLVVTLSRIYVLGSDGVYVFDYNLNQLSFAPISPQVFGGQLAVTSNGSLVVSLRNGTTYIFLPN
jgi:hypothetical protein